MILPGVLQPDRSLMLRPPSPQLLGGGRRNLYAMVLREQQEETEQLSPVREKSQEQQEEAEEAKARLRRKADVLSIGRTTLPMNAKPLLTRPLMMSSIGAQNTKHK